MRLEFEAGPTLRWEICFLCSERERIIRIFLVRPYIGNPNTWGATFEKVLVGHACNNCAHELYELTDKVKPRIHVPYHIAEKQIGRYVRMYKRKKEAELCGLQCR